MPQKLSAWNYIKNNKGRTAVLIVSLCLCFVLTYLTRFLLSTTEETFRPICLENSRKIQYIELAGSSLGLDVENLSIEEIRPLYYQKIEEMVERLKTHDGVKEVYNAQILWIEITPAIGVETNEIPLVSAEEIPVILEHFDTGLLEGRLPEHPGEIVLDEASVKNNGYELNGYVEEQSYGKTFQIVGILDCDSYFGCGIPSETVTLSTRITVLSQGIDDMSAELKEEGIQVRDSFDYVSDYVVESAFFEKEIVGVIGNSTQLISLGVMVLLALSLIIVYTMYLRERHNEWCLYCSIGYSRKTIYLSIFRELLFTFVVALLIGSLIIGGSELVIDAVMIQPKGLKCKYFHPETLGEILCSYVLILGILQLPVRYALYRIRTVDAIEDDLY